MSEPPARDTAKATHRGIAQRVRKIRGSSDVIDPGMADEKTLREFGLPPKPDPRTHPRLHAIWTETFGRPLRFSGDAGKRGKNTRPAAARNASTATPNPLSATRLEDSPNWSGASITANHGRTFQQIWGQWNVPEPKPPVPATRTATKYQCAAWIGLDGQRLYRHSTLPQAGTLQEVTVTAKKKPVFRTQAWVQWWVRGDPDTLPVFLDDFPVEHGDTICCVLRAITPITVLVNFVNRNKAVAASLEITAPHDMPPDNSPISIGGSTAEWVMERPTNPNTNELSPFPDYGAVQFKMCHAVEAFADLASPVERNLEVANYFRMFKVRPDPQRTTFISVPRRIDATSFQCRSVPV